MARLRTGARVTRDDRREWDRLAREMQNIRSRGGRSVRVGLFGEQGSDLVKYASAHEFGATIRRTGSPGGVAYGFRTRADVDANRVRFMSRGQGFMELGRTRPGGPHEIKIPQRSFLRSMVDENKRKIKKFVALQFKAFALHNQTLEIALRKIGIFAVGLVKLKILRGPFVPLARSTIRRKRSSRPLIDTGRMRASITFKPGR